jgi:hypothetical protein
MEVDMKKIIVLLMICLLSVGCGCQLGGMFLGGLSRISDSAPDNLTDRDEIIALFHDNETAFLKAAETNSFDDLLSIYGVSHVYVHDNGIVDISCGGKGMGSNTHYYGIYYSEDDDLCAIDVAPGDSSALTERDGGFSWEESGGDNSYYVEPLGNHYFYYEAHY